MVTAKDFRRIYRYNRAVMEAYERKLSRLPWAVVSKDREATWHSMAGVFHHVVGVYNGWLCHVVQGKDVEEAMASKRWNQLASMKEVRAYHRAVWAEVDVLLAGLTDASLRHRVKAPWQPRSCPLEDVLLQVTFETAHHLGEIIAMLWQEDIEPPRMTWLDTNWWLEAVAERQRRKTSSRRPHRNT